MTAAKAKLIPLGDTVDRFLLRKIESSVRDGLRMPQSSEINEGTQDYTIVELPVGYRAVVYDKNGPVGQTPKKPFYPFVRFNKADAHEEIVPVCIGDRIYLARHKGFKIETNSGEELYVAEVDDILAVEVDVESGFPGGGDPQVACKRHKIGESTGELHEPHKCSACGAACDGDDPCLAEEVSA